MRRDNFCRLHGNTDAPCPECWLAFEEQRKRVVTNVDRLTRELDDARADIDRLRTLLREVRQSGVEHDAPGVGYVTVQIDRQTWADLAAALEGGDE